MPKYYNTTHFEKQPFFSILYLEAFSAYILSKEGFKDTDAV